MNLTLSPELRLELKSAAECRVETGFSAGVALVKLMFDNVPEPFSVCWNIPQCDIQFRWTSVAGKIGEDYPQFLPPAWRSNFDSEFTRNAPVFALVGAGGRNRLAVAVSDAKNRIGFFAGVGEESFAMECRLEFSGFPAEGGYEVDLRFDLRDIPFEDALRDGSAWWERFYPPLAVPDAALNAVYSTWYSYHREITAQAVETEARASLPYGVDTVIVDDGWQETGSSSGYAFSGEWCVDKTRFPDMAAHVARVQASGMKYMLWIALPFVGEDSRIFPEMREKLLYFSPGLNCWIVDPRFPEVREYLISCCTGLAGELKLDGLKIDFLDRFPLPSGLADPAVAENFAGRDCRSIPEALEKLLSALTAELLACSPDFLLEYRQDYIGPAMREYANIFRASDCPGDRIANRRRIVNLRLLSGGTAVHSDMLGWHTQEPVESAARQLWNVIFSVPQISVRLETLPEEHRRMLRFILDFQREHRELFLQCEIFAPHPELNYPHVTAGNASASVTVLYEEGAVISLPEGKRSIVVNASTADTIPVDCPGGRFEGEVFDCLGISRGRVSLSGGIGKVAVPPSGILMQLR